MKNYNPSNSTWLHGKYTWKQGKETINAEINTSLPYTAIGSFFAQGEDAGNIIEEIYKIWVKRRVTQPTAIKRWANSMLSEY